MRIGRGAGDLDLAVLTDSAALDDLASEWDALWRAARGRFAESPAVARLAWTHVAGPAGARLALVVGRQDGDLVLMLPMTVSRRGPLRVLRPLGPGAADYTGLLVAPGGDRSHMIATGWHLLSRSGGADVVQLPGLAPGSDLHAVVARQPAARVIATDVLAVADPSAGESFEQYCAGLGRLSHMRPGGLRRRLARAGRLEITVLPPGDSSIPALVDWMLQRKREWAQRADKNGAWLADRRFRDFVVAALTATDGDPVARILELRLDGQPVAATVMGMGASRAEGLINGFDPAYGRYSPGLIGVEACVEWAFSQGLGLEFGVGAEEYKLYWSRGEACEWLNLQVPLGVRGRLALDARSIAGRAAAALTGG